MKKKVTIVVVIVLVIVLIAACVMWRIGGVETESALGDHQKYVYAYVSSIEGNEVTYMEVDESVAKAAEERAKEKTKAEDGAGSDSTEQSGQMQMPPDMDSTEMPQGAPGGMSDMTGETVTTMIPVGVTVHTTSDTTTTFSRLASGDLLKILVETDSDGNEVIEEIWKIIVKPVPVSQYHKSKAEFYNQSREPYTQKGAHMDAAQILKPFANEHIPADTKKTATAEHTSEIITMQNVNKSYKMGSGSLHVLKDISLTVEQGEYLAILGPSGSGKSTLMNIIGCMDVLDEGTYNLDGVEIEKAKEKELTNIRNQKIGFIFQKYHLIPTYNVLQNIVMPLLMRGMTLKDARDASMDTIAMLGLAERIDHKPNELSGGQQQRVAIARALVGQPAILLADEPTGALDRNSGKEVLKLFQCLSDMGNTIVMITHDLSVAEHAKRVVRIVDGELYEN